MLAVGVEAIIAFSAWGTLGIAVTTDMAVGAWGATTVATLGGFFLADALHHFLTRSFGCCGHDFATGWFAQAAPQGLTAHGNGFGLFAFFGAKAFDDDHGHLLVGENFNVTHEALFV